MSASEIINVDYTIPESYFDFKFILKDSNESLYFSKCVLIFASPLLASIVKDKDSITVPYQKENMLQVMNFMIHKKFNPGGKFDLLKIAVIAHEFGLDELSKQCTMAIAGGLKHLEESRGWCFMIMFIVKNIPTKYHFFFKSHYDTTFDAKIKDRDIIKSTEVTEKHFKLLSGENVQRYIRLLLISSQNEGKKEFVKKELKNITAMDLLKETDWNIINLIKLGDEKLIRECFQELASKYIGYSSDEDSDESDDEIQTVDRIPEPDIKKQKVEDY